MVSNVDQSRGENVRMLVLIFVKNVFLWFVPELKLNSKKSISLISYVIEC